MFSFGIEPSTTSTKGASSSSRAAWRKGSRNSSPPSVGDSTLLCRLTLGMPGSAPSSTSAMLGCPAAVIETESPSQLIPSEIHRMWTSSTPGAFGSVAISHSPRRKHRLELEGRALGHRALRHQLERERQRVRDHLAQVAHLQLDVRHPPVAGVVAHDADHGLGA